MGAYTGVGTVKAAAAVGEANAMGIDWESSHKVINALVEALQRNFKADAGYLRPLMPPRANVMFVVDKETAEAMVMYMAAKLKHVGEFDENEFRFTRKPGCNGEILQRIRLEFPSGVNADVIRRMLVATDRLGPVLSG